MREEELPPSLRRKRSAQFSQQVSGAFKPKFAQKKNNKEKLRSAGQATSANLIAAPPRGDISPPSLHDDTRVNDVITENGRRGGLIQIEPESELVERNEEGELVPVRPYLDQEEQRQREEEYIREQQSQQQQPLRQQQPQEYQPHRQATSSESGRLQTSRHTDGQAGFAQQQEDYRQRQSYTQTTTRRPVRQHQQQQPYSRRQQGVQQPQTVVQGRYPGQPLNQATVTASRFVWSPSQLTTPKPLDSGSLRQGSLEDVQFGHLNGQVPVAAPIESGWVGSNPDPWAQQTTNFRRRGY